jgi:cytochrome P450
MTVLRDRDGGTVRVPDLGDARAYEGDLDGVWGWLRDERPVYWNPCGGGEVAGFWVVSRYADVVGVYRDPAAFTSERGNLLTALLAGGDSAGGRMVAVSDGPRHAAVRRLLARSLGPRTMRRLGAQVAAATQELVAGAVERGGVDFAADVAAHVPLATICDLLGVPAADRPFIQRQTSVALGSDTPTQSTAETWLARNEILLYFRELAGHRRAAPADDLVTALAVGRIDGAELTEDEVVLNCYSLILGGDETTRMSMAGAAQALATHPEQWRRLRSGDVDVPAAVEEVLRWTVPAMHAGRTATRDTELCGTAIRAGDIVTVWHVSANRDEREFPAPHRFDLGRAPNRHLSFGYGTHFCLGASLARIELAALLTALRTQVAGIELTGAPTRIWSTFLTGYTELPVRLVPAART